MDELEDTQAAGSRNHSDNLEAMLAANRQFVAGGRPRALPDAPARNVAVLTCIDMRLTGMWAEALGLKRGDALVLRNAGNTIAAGDDDVLRSLAVGVYLKGISEIVVLGHTDCGMTQIRAGAFTDAMTRAGVSRDAIPGMDLREWLGAFAREEDNVRDTVRTIRNCELIPDEVQVHGLLLDIETGEVSVVE